MGLGKYRCKKAQKDFYHYPHSLMQIKNSLQFYYSPYASFAFQLSHSLHKPDQEDMNIANILPNTYYKSNHTWIITNK